MPSLALRLAATLLLALAASSCASVEFERETRTSGTFRSSATSFTFLSWDVPKHALLIARENASDAAQANTIIVEESVIPNLGPLDWLLDIISVRHARVSGTWGVTGEGPPGS